MCLKKALYFLFFLWFFSSCVTTKSQTVRRSSFNELQIQKLEKALQLMEKKDFLRAAKLFDSLSLHSKKPDVQILSFYNAGLAYKLSGDCERALSRFRSVLDKSFKKLKEYQAISLLEISSVYECLGQNNQALSSLKDLGNKLQYLSLSFQQILYPARLSIAWSKQGDFIKANQYQSLALAKVLNYKKALREADLKKELARLFYLMGKSYVKKKHLQAEPFVSSFLYHQAFLLQSLFLKEKEWSSLAKDELDKLFDHLKLLVLEDKHKEPVEKALAMGLSFIEKEDSKKLQNYYSKKLKSIQKLFSQKN